MDRYEKTFRDPETGNEIVAQNEIQADAFKAQGFKAVKASKMDTEFASESLDPQAMANATNSASMNQQAQTNAMPNMNTTNMGASAMDAEFSQELDQETTMKEAQRNATADATASASKTAKRNNK
jgi:hypothetical protein